MMGGSEVTRLDNTYKDWIKTRIEQERVSKGWTVYRLLKEAYGFQHEGARKDLQHETYNPSLKVVFPMLSVLGLKSLSKTKRK